MGESLLSGHNKHVDASVAATTGEYVPRAQLTHCVSPVLFWYVPSGHGVHALAAFKYVPAAQRPAHVVAATLEYVPDAHVVHVAIDEL